MKKKFPVFSLTVLFFVFGLTILGPLFYNISPYELSAGNILLPPSFDNPLGTDRLGRDLLARLMKGGQTSLLIGIGSALIASLLGLIIGVSAGFFGKIADKSIIVLIDLFLTFPTFFLLLALISYIEASAWALIVVISITGWMGMARLIRSESFAIAQKPFIKILNIANVSPSTIIFKYFTPLLSPIFFISFTFGVSGAILAESGLSFLGIGIMPPQMSWGSILAEGKEVLDVAWWVSFFPGFMIFLVTYSLIKLSDFMQAYTNQNEFIS
ncbi:MAG: ABC transporter permease [Campylobacteraceae bacterium]|nr:ABC transporter permease [Campylobacteraceae bacterium]